MNKKDSTDSINPINPMTQIPNDVMTIFIELCNPFSTSVPAVRLEEDWQHISELSKLHGVTPFLYYRTRSLGIKLPEQIEKKWLGVYLYQIAEEQKARRQIKELSEILDSAGIIFVLLKGASAMLRLYPQPGLRTFVDLDILIPVDKVSEFKKVMAKAGYKPLAARNSLEDEELKKFDGHLDPFLKEKSIMIEPHLSILDVGGEHLVALPEIWRDKEKTNTNGVEVSHLSKEQFIVHTLLHCSRHLSDEGIIEIKGFTDLLYAIRTWRIDWSKVRDIARKWSLDNDILPVMATLNHYWQADIPLTEKAIPIELQTLVLGVKDWQKQYYSNVPASYLERFLKIRELPDTTSRVRYLFHLFFPTPENLRWRYNLSSKWPIIPYYFIHILVTFKKVFLGLWHLLLYHPSNNFN